MVFFADVFEEFYIIAVIMDPIQTSVLAPDSLNTLCQIEKMTECPQNRRVYRTIISNWSSEVK